MEAVIIAASFLVHQVSNDDESPHVLSNFPWRVSFGYSWAGPGWQGRTEMTALAKLLNRRFPNNAFLHDNGYILCRYEDDARMFENWFSYQNRMPLKLFFK